MALPNSIDPTTPAGSDSPAGGDDQFRDLKTFLTDLFGIQAAATTYAAAMLRLQSGGGTQAFENLLVNYSMEKWGAGAAVAPDNWTLTGAGATIATNTTGGQFKHGAASAAVTRVGTDCYLNQNVLATAHPAVAGGTAYVAGRVYTLGAWVRATVASRARISIHDGVGETLSGYHTGGSTFEYLTVTRTLDASATTLTARLYVDTGNTTAQFDAVTLHEGAQAPSVAVNVVEPFIGARVYNSANIAVADASRTDLTFDTERYDSGGFHSTVSNTERLTAPVSGKYLIWGGFNITAGADYALVLADIRLNAGQTIIAEVVHTPSTANASPALVVSTIYALAATDYVVLTAYQDNTANASRNATLSANYSPEFGIAYLGP